MIRGGRGRERERERGRTLCGLSICNQVVNSLSHSSLSFVHFDSVFCSPLLSSSSLLSLSVPTPHLPLSLCPHSSSQFWTQLDKRYSNKHVVFCDVCNMWVFSMSLCLPPFPPYLSSSFPLSLPLSPSPSLPPFPLSLPFLSPPLSSLPPFPLPPFSLSLPFLSPSLSFLSPSLPLSLSNRSLVL